MNESFSQFVSSVVTAISQCSLYSKEHPAVADFCEKAIGFLQELFTDESISITHLGGNLVFNDIPLPEKGIHVENFMKRMKTKGIDKVIFKKGISTEELISFISQMASKDEVPKSAEHILVGTIQVRLKTSGDDPSEIMKANISRVQGVYQEVSRFKRLDTVGLEDAVLGFLSALKKEANVLRLISPVKSYSEYTYIHTSNVAVLTLFQAESLGLTGESLREAGLAGLLHDVGKLFVSKDVLEKQGKLDDSEWKEMKRHPAYGAMYLCSLEDPPRLGVIAAYEHHLKFDGTGYPDTKRHVKKQHILSQIVALADFFDALRSERPYRKAFELNALIDLIKGGAGKDFNPLLVDNFISALQKTGVLLS
jgi:HD-GYP domain-containing protein (c-di-GMP phosphodiesterase class II)